MKRIIKIAEYILGFIYFCLKKLPTQKKILFLSRQSDSPSMDITVLQQEINKLHPDYKVTVLCKKLNKSLKGLITYALHMLSQMYHLATSEAVVLDSYAILVSLLNHKKELLVIQMWHSVGTMKKFGYSILDQPEGSSSAIAHAMKMHKNYDYILCAGKGYRSHLADGFNYPEDKIIIKPLPRVEILKDTSYIEKNRQQIYSAYPKLRSKKNILYVPTFRKNESEEKEFVTALENLKNAAEKYSNEYNLIVKAHPLSNTISDCKEFSSFDMLAVADYVISDYSCIIYEAAILHIPLYFYTYDYETYTATRDIYMDYPNEIPSKMYADPKQLLDSLVSEQYDMERLENFLRKYVSYTDENITKNIVDFIWENK